MTRVQQLLSWLHAQQYTWDLTALVGMVLLVAGVWMVSAAVAIMLLGICLLALSLWGARAHGRPRSQQGDA